MWEVNPTKIQDLPYKLCTWGSSGLRYAGTSSLNKAHSIALYPSCHQDRSLLLSKHVSVQKAACSALLQPIYLMTWSASFELDPDREGMGPKSRLWDDEHCWLSNKTGLLSRIRDIHGEKRCLCDLYSQPRLGESQHRDYRILRQSHIICRI